ncbi:4-hydroxy-2-oxoheptanedioate aldolase [soil metagenome]
MKIKKELSQGKPKIGCWVNLGSNVSAEIIGQSGYDWALIDLEHGAGNEAMMYLQLQAMQKSQIAPIVRIDEVSRPKVQRILDSGASGIMFPQVKSEEEARYAISCMYYPPKGVRGVAKMVRVVSFGKDFETYQSTLTENLLGIIQIETLEALEDVEKIAAIDGVDILFVGPSDLTMAMGISGQLQHPDYQAAIQKIGKAAKKYNKATGVLQFSINEYDVYRQHGYQFIALGADSTFIVKGAAEIVNQWNEKINH